MKKYIRGKRIRKGTAVIMVIAAIAMILLNACTAEEPAWDVCYEMTNRNIEWTYAGR